MRIPNVKYVQGRNSYDDKDDWKYGVAIHNTSNTASAANEADYATRRTDGVSAHLYVDGKEVIQSIDLLARTGHAGSSNGNEHAVSVEITGLNSWSRDKWLGAVNWTALGSALAWVCGQFGITVRRASVSEMRSNPKVRAFYSHDDMRQAWGGTDHTDPGPNFPWDRLFQAVQSGGAPPVVAATQEDDDVAQLFHHTTKDSPAVTLWAHLGGGRLNVTDGPVPQTLANKIAVPPQANAANKGTGDSTTLNAEEWNALQDWFGVEGFEVDVKTGKRVTA